MEVRGFSYILVIILLTAAATPTPELKVENAELSLQNNSANLVESSSTENKEWTPKFWSDFSDKFKRQLTGLHLAPVLGSPIKEPYSEDSENVYDKDETPIPAQYEWITKWFLINTEKVKRNIEISNNTVLIKMTIGNPICLFFCQSFNNATVTYL
ncbi:unnamed protein product [Allacma fusca]|uniref:Uncharacterized protein n=1 Tax=Allacma fusca TaxID=39272 RepID=A0A8J2KN05_9HEXA|nr:unnamed protein product [Allacma fusca]